jgi:hypothetical protein
MRLRKTMLAAVLTAAVLAFPALAASAAPAVTVPVNFSNNQSGIEVNGAISYVQAVFTLPRVAAPNERTSLAVYLADGTQSVVLALGPVSDGGSYTATLQNEVPTPGLPPGYADGYADNTDAYAYAPGDKVELAESYSYPNPNGPVGQLTYTVIDLTDVTIPVFSGQFTDSAGEFLTAFAGALFATDVYGTPTEFIQPAAKTELVAGTHVLVLDTAGKDVTGVAKVRTAAGGSNLGVKLTSVSTSSAGKNFTVDLLPAK